MSKIFVKVCGRFIQWALSVCIHLYRVLISPLLGANCRFTPSCSQYALAAIHQQGVARGLWLSLKRLSRCHPGSMGGYDPVPHLFK